MTSYCSDRSQRFGVMWSRQSNGQLTSKCHHSYWLYVFSGTLIIYCPQISPWPVFSGQFTIRCPRRSRCSCIWWPVYSYLTIQLSMFLYLVASLQLLVHTDLDVSVFSGQFTTYGLCRFGCLVISSQSTSLTDLGQSALHVCFCILSSNDTSLFSLVPGNLYRNAVHRP